jgi:DNA-directed RNA polymerase subunit beta
VRANVASNQQRQALPLLKNESPLVGTGLEKEILHMSNAVILAEAKGEVIYVDGKRIKVKYTKGIKEYTLTNFAKSNQKSVIHQTPSVSLGDKVKKGQLLAEGPSALNGELAIGVNLKIAFMPWE